MLIIHMKTFLSLHNFSMIFYYLIILSSTSSIFFSLIKFFINTKRFKKLLYCNMENINSILNRRKIYCYIIEEIIGLKLPDYQFMKYINNFENFSVVTQHSTNISITLCPLYLHIYIKIWNKIHIIFSSR